MKVYRLSKEKYKKALSGKGAELYAGRWNSKGVPMLYTSASRALCTTEIAVHTPLGIIPSGYWLTTITIPDSIEILEINPNKLPADWKSFPYHHSTQEMGDKFIADAKYLVMKAPSVVVKDEFNYLINPAHRLFSKIKIISTEVFEFDERLFKR